jgi:hypothetical protein
VGDNLHQARRGPELGQQLIQMDCAGVFRQWPGVRLADLSNEKEAGNGARLTKTNVGVSHGDYCRRWKAFAATVQFKGVGRIIALYMYWFLKSLREQGLYWDFQLGIAGRLLD